MKLTPRAAIAILTLLPYLARAVPPIDTPDDVKLHGYVGYLSNPPTGDWVTSTYCYCAQPYHLAPRFPDEGSYFQWEYYNYHRNATYVMHRLCKRNHNEDETCVNPKRAHCIPELDGFCAGNALCTSWGRGSAAVLARRDDDSFPSSSASSAEGDNETKPDRWCMTLDDRNPIQKIMGGGDTINWNMQSRRLTKKGRQGRREQSDADVGVACTELCKTKVGMRLLTADRHVKSHQEVFESVDDMCDDCRR